MKFRKNYQGRAIVTYSRSLISLMIAQSLGARGVDIVGCDDVGMTVLSFSKYVSAHKVYTAPHKDEERFITDLLRIVKKYRPDKDVPYVLIPSFNEAKIIARHKDRFEGQVIVACPDFEMIDAVDPKDHFAETAQKIGLKSPQTWMPADEDALGKAVEEISFPVFIKPPNDVGGRGISKVKDEKALRAAFKDLQKRYPDEQILIQALAGGTDYCFCGLFDHGRLVSYMVYHNIRKFPHESGPGVVRETVDGAPFIGEVEKLMGALKWHGVAEIDFLWDERRDAPPQMIEVNPRFWAGLDHSIRSGVDFPWHLYRLFTEGSAGEPDIELKIGHKTSLPGLSSLARIEELFSGAFHPEALEEQWPAVMDALKGSVQDKDLKKAARLLKEALADTITLDEIFETFKAMRREAKEAEKISYAKDDPFIGLGVLFVLASLMKYGKLPPEMTR